MRKLLESFNELNFQSSVIFSVLFDYWRLHKVVTWEIYAWKQSDRNGEEVEMIGEAQIWISLAVGTKFSIRYEIISSAELKTKHDKKPLQKRVFFILRRLKIALRLDLPSFSLAFKLVVDEQTKKTHEKTII